MRPSSSRLGNLARRGWLRLDAFIRHPLVTWVVLPFFLAAQFGLFGDRVANATTGTFLLVSVVVIIHGIIAGRVAMHDPRRWLGDNWWLFMVAAVSALLISRALTG